LLTQDPDRSAQQQAGSQCELLAAGVTRISLKPHPLLPAQQLHKLVDGSTVITRCIN